MKEVFRSEVDQLFLEEMVAEDANFLLLGDSEDEVDNIISNTSNGVFDDDPLPSDYDYDEEEDFIFNN